MRILVTGATGQLGLALIRDFLEDKNFSDSLFLTVKGGMEWALLHEKMEKAKLLSSSADIHPMDITDEIAVRTTCMQFMPDVIINCSAYTLVEEAEEEANKEIARLVNVDGTRILAQAAKEFGAKFVHISTDYVFDGTKNSPYIETDAKNPINFYGETKSLGEEEALSNCEKTFVIRTSWLYGTGKNFVETMLSQAEKKTELKVVSTQVGSPTSAKELVRLIRFLMNTEAYGIWHGSCEGETSRYGFVTEIMRLAGKDVTVLPVGDEAYPTKAKRPAYSVLANKRLAEETTFRMADWKDALKEYMNDKKEGKL